MTGAFYKPVKEPGQSWQKSSMATGLILPEEYKKGRKRQKEWWKEKSDFMRK